MPASNRRVTNVTAEVEYVYQNRRRVSAIVAMAENRKPDRRRISDVVLMVEYKIDFPPQREFGPGGEWS
jgi:hypothetical protein